MIVIGSTAIKYWYPDFKREPKDVDYLVLDKSRWKHREGVEYLENPKIWRWVNEHTEYLEPNLLLTLKASHLAWDINWDKHMFDVQFLLKMGHVIDPEKFFILYKHWNEYHSKNKRSDLKMSKEDFFDNAINYNESEHDDLHKILNPEPVYTLVLKEGKEVELDEQKFNSLSHKQKLDFVREEVMVMAYERYKHLNYMSAYSKMLKKFILSHAPLFSLLFIIENYIELHKPKFNYIKTIKDGINHN